MGRSGLLDAALLAVVEAVQMISVQRLTR